MQQEESSRKFAESQMPIGIAYFTAKTEDYRLVREAELRKLSDQYISVATQHFTRLAAVKEANGRMPCLRQSNTCRGLLREG